MNNKININPSSTKWLEKDDRVVADYFCDLGFRSLKQILDMRVFDLMNMQGLNAVRVEEVIICLYKWLNPNTAIDEAIYNGMMSQPFLYTPWRKEHKDLAAIKVGDLVLTPGINMKAIQHFYDAIRRINSKQFVHGIMRTNQMDTSKTYVLSGEFLEEKNTAVFSLVEGVSLRTQKGMAQS